MLKASDISNATFAKSMNGYKQDEVDELLDTIEADYQQFGKVVTDLQAKIATLTKENDELRTAGNSIQNVLVSAQLLADQIVNDAKAKAEEITAKAEIDAADTLKASQAAAEEADKKAAVAQKIAEDKIASMMKEAVQKSEGMITAAHDSVARQQLLFDQLKAEIASFKQEITQKYKEHVELLSKIPDEVPFDASHAADALCALITEKPDLSQFIPSEATTATEESKPQEPEPQEAVAPEEAAEKVAPSSAPPVSATQMGFQIQTDILGESVKEDIEEKEPAGLFRKRNK